MVCLRPVISSADRTSTHAAAAAAARGPIRSTSGHGICVQTDCAVLRQIGKCLEPTWNEEFRFRLSSQSPRLTVYVMDQNVVFDDQEIGRHGCMLCATEASLS